MLIAIFKYVYAAVRIGRHHFVDAFLIVDDHYGFVVNGKIGSAFFLKLQNLIAVRHIILCGGCQKLLHLLGVHRRSIAGAKGRHIVCIQQECRSFKKFRHFPLNGKGCLGIFCRYGGFAGTDQLSVFLAVQGNQQNRLFHSIVCNGCNVTLDGQSRDAIAFLARFHTGILTLLGIGYGFRQQLTEFIGTADRYLVFGADRLGSVSGYGEHTRQGHQNQKYRKNFFAVFHKHSPSPILYGFSC